MLLYYIACIYVKALGRLRGRDIQDHYSLKEWLNGEPDLVSIAKPYRKLEERSRDARYEGRSFTTREMDEAHRWFCTIRDTVVKLLRSAGVSNAPSVEPRPWL